MDGQRGAAAVRIVIAAPFPAIVELHRRLIEEPDEVEVCAAVHQPDGILEQVGTLRPDVLVISDQLDVDRDHLRTSLASASAATRMLVLSNSDAPGSSAVEAAGAIDQGSPSPALRDAIRRAARGALDVPEAPPAHAGRAVGPDAVEPAPGAKRGWPQVGAQNDRSVTPTAEAGAENPDGRIILVFSGKGGVGKSVLATNLAVLLAQRGASVVLVDLDLQYGDVGVLLRVESHPTSIDSLMRSGELNPQLLDEALATGPEGVRALLAPTDPADAGAVNAAAIHAVLAELRRGHDYVVVDSATHLDDGLRAAIDMADTIAVVSTFSITSVKDTKITLKVMESLGVGRDRIAVVLNQARAKITFDRADIERSLRFPVLSHLPHDPDVDQAIDTGTPLVVSEPRSDFARQVAVIADHVGGLADAAAGAELTPRRRLRLRR